MTSVVWGWFFTFSFTVNLSAWWDQQWEYFSSRSISALSVYFGWQLVGPIL